MPYIKNKYMDNFKLLVHPLTYEKLASNSENNITISSNLVRLLEFTVDRITMLVAGRQTSQNLATWRSKPPTRTGKPTQPSRTAVAPTPPRPTRTPSPSSYQSSLVLSP